MAIFKENLTSKILQENSLMVLNSFNVEKKVLEIGCGNGNITKHLLKNQKQVKEDLLLNLNQSLDRLKD